MGSHSIDAQQNLVNDLFDAIVNTVALSSAPQMIRNMLYFYPNVQFVSSVCYRAPVTASDTISIGTMHLLNVYVNLTLITMHISIIQPISETLKKCNSV